MKTILKFIDIAARMFLSAFAFFFAFAAICATVCLFVEKDFMAIIGIIAASFLSWTCWEVRRDI